MGEANNNKKRKTVTFTMGTSTGILLCTFLDSMITAIKEGTDDIPEKDRIALARIENTFAKMVMQLPKDVLESAETKE